MAIVTRRERPDSPTDAPGTIDDSIAIDALTALSHATRLSAFRQLVQLGSDGLAVGELRARLAIPAATLTAHLNTLRAAGLVTDHREGRIIRVHANHQRMNALLGYLTENCCAGQRECAPAACVVR